MKYNLSTICKAANRFHKQGYSRSAAFVLAWRLAKETATTKVAGVTYGNRQNVLAQIAAAPEAVRVELRREHNNRLDCNAIAVVIVSNGCAEKVGYIPAKAARLIAPIMDAGRAVRATLEGVYGGWREGMSYGARLRLAM